MKTDLGWIFHVSSITHIWNQFPCMIITFPIPLRWCWFIFDLCKWFNIKLVFKYISQKCLKWSQMVDLPYILHVYIFFLFPTCIMWTCWTCVRASIIQIKDNSDKRPLVLTLDKIFWNVQISWDFEFFENLLLIALTCANFDLSNFNFVRECTDTVRETDMFKFYCFYV